MKKKCVSLFFGMLLGVSTATAIAAAPSTATIKAGTYPSYPPLDMRDTATNELTGFDIELGESLAKRVGQPLTWVETNYAELIAATKTGRVDIFFNGMFDTPEREQQISFVDYLRSGSQFVGMAGGSFKTAESLCGKRIGISRITSAPAELVNWNAAVCAKKNLPAAIYVPAENSTDARMQMKQGRVDAVFMDSLTIPYIISQDKTLAMIGEPVEYTRMGIGVAKGQEALGQKIGKALQAMIDDGSYAKLMDKWGLPKTSALQKVLINNKEAL